MDPENRKTEADVERDPARVDSRNEDDSAVGRMAEDESPDVGETGAERRAAAHRSEG